MALAKSPEFVAPGFTPRLQIDPLPYGAQTITLEFEDLSAYEDVIESSTSIASLDALTAHLNALWTEEWYAAEELKMRTLRRYMFLIEMINNRRDESEKLLQALEVEERLEATVRAPGKRMVGYSKVSSL